MARHIFSSTFNLGELWAVVLEPPLLAVAGLHVRSGPLVTACVLVLRGWQGNILLFFMFAVRTHRSFQFYDDRSQALKAGSHHGDALLRHKRCSEQILNIEVSWCIKPSDILTVVYNYRAPAGSCVRTINPLPGAALPTFIQVVEIDNTGVGSAALQWVVPVSQR